MMVVGAVGYAIVISLLLRVDLRGLKDVRLRYEVLLPAGLALQLGAPYLPGVADSWVPAVWQVGALLLIVTSLLNWDYLGFKVVAAGVLLNAAVILVNWGMPVSADALVYLGAHDFESLIAASSPLYFLADEATSLLTLGDVLPVPGPSIIRSVASLGDVMLMIGVVVLIIEMAETPIRPKPSVG